MKYNTLTGEITGTPDEIVEFLKKYKQEEYSQINIPFVQWPNQPHNPYNPWTITCSTTEVNGNKWNNITYL